MAKKTVLYVALFIIIGSLLSMACVVKPASCSHGFWKNRGHYHYNYGEWNVPHYDWLFSRGKGSEAEREWVRNWLNVRYNDADQFCLD